MMRKSGTLSGMTDHLDVATKLAEQVQEDAKRLGTEFSKPLDDRDRDRINRLNDRARRTIKRAEVHSLMSISQRLDDIHQLLDERLAELSDALLVEEES